ncbi:MAG TPA: hypothetical protein VF723_04935 [Pyrinomonadaceae bacterium]|jgi:hypothetical protein
MKHAWTILSVLCLLLAALFLLRADQNAAFVAATLGVLAWFINYRNRLSSTLIKEEEANEGEEDGGSDED